MNDQTNSISAPTTAKIKSTDIMIGAILPSHITTKLIQPTTTTTNGPTSVANGSALTVTSLVTSKTNPNIPLFGNYTIAFFEGALTTDKIIGYTLVHNYIVQGPFLMPAFSPHYAAGITSGGSDGNNLIYNTSIINNTGGSVNLYWITNTRVIQTGGKAA